ncbi:MAG: hypothetical protein GBAus27B_000403 [Mycoplasmataceae bacterium]|nr:MAG: hypothetical protein GBAus27B_000403 [Mycoplasmataceae bacterium]
MNEILTNQTANHCPCHVIDPRKIRVLLWKNPDPKAVNTYLLKIADQKFIGLSRVDKRGETYWKFREYYENDKSESSSVHESIENKFEIKWLIGYLTEKTV